jgi:hypothetical protein
MRIIRITVLLWCIVGLSTDARAQGASGSTDWTVTVYPIFVWVPLDFGIDVDVSGGGGESISGQILDSRFDGAFFGGAAATNGPWRIEGYGAARRAGFLCDGRRPARRSEVGPHAGYAAASVTRARSLGSHRRDWLASRGFARGVACLV